MPITRYNRDAICSMHDDTLPDESKAIAVEHRDGCPNGKPGWPDQSRTELDRECRKHGCRIGYSHRFFTGRVVKLREHNMHDASDFFATVLHKGKFIELGYATTRFCTSYFDGAHCDATPIVAHAYMEHKDFLEIKAQRDYEAHQRKLRNIRAQMPSFGEVWRVKSKRSKIPYGTVVEVAGDPMLSDYCVSRYPDRTGLPKQPLEERWQERPSDIVVKVRLSDGSTKWISSSCIERES